MAGRIPSKTLSLKQFMTRQQVLKLYRDILKAIQRIPDDRNRNELKDWARSDFKQHKNQTDEHKIKALIFHGERSLKELNQSLDLSNN
ncbi:LYR motif-containing protein 2 [Neocloeon triangulifer]|uniref:LYR motif-containing protein 2 n=1 Tax=Neocloeon triangulifer TaxID=2078957 RepID=UPI00286EE8F0|nr:LYR motif-containing protein 2 [Neocloeon triangulifer]